MTNILLITSLISILSNSFSKVIAHARFVDLSCRHGRLTDFVQGGILIRVFGIRTRGMDEESCRHFVANSYSGFHQQSSYTFRPTFGKYHAWEEKYIRNTNQLSEPDTPHLHTAT